MTPIKYIGHRQTYRDGCYGSGLVFAQDQTINVEDEVLAKKLLRHPDVYVPGGAEEATTTADAGSVAGKDGDEDQKQDMRDSLAAMNKPALATFAKTHFGADLDKRKSIDDLRLQVTGLFDQFGVE